MSNSKRLVINADDFGLSPAINAGIRESHTHGIVTSTSIVAAGSAFDEAVQISRAQRSLGIGVHLTLVQENSVCDPAKVSSLAPYGVLPQSYAALVAGVITGRISLVEIEREFRAQVEKCLSAGINLIHLDSHQHTHALPMIFSRALRVAQDYKIRGIRIPRGWPSPQDVRANRFLPKCVLSLLSTFDRVFFPLGSCMTTDHFEGLFESGSLGEWRLLQILHQLKDGVTELVCHPGHPDRNPRYARWNERRQVELAALTSDSAKETIRRLGIQLVNYRQLGTDSAKTAG